MHSHLVGHHATYTVWEEILEGKNCGESLLNDVENLVTLLT